MTSAPVLLVTGGSRGIGAAVARLAAARGFDVAVNYRRERAAAEAVIADVRTAGRRGLAVAGDMSREEDVSAVFDAVDGALGPLTHLVYNAGVTGKPSRLEDATAETMRDVLDLNVLGALLSAQAAIPRMSCRHGGRGGAIVMLSSAAATLGSAGEYVWYAASKGAIDSLTLGLAKELAADAIRVNAVAPGFIATDIHVPGRLERVIPAVPLQRAGTPEEVAEAVLYLLSDAASYVTGTVLRVAGGR
jgi:NAD(P)-dependent dehydrogenase (short-subunit alcohol dehydrogenase family)